jgi:hypothetical protein
LQVVRRVEIEGAFDEAAIPARAIILLRLNADFGNTFLETFSF